MIMTGPATAVWSGVFVHSVEQHAGMCCFHFWDAADILTDELCCCAACLPAKELREMRRLLLQKPIRERLMKMGYISPPLSGFDKVLKFEKGVVSLVEMTIKELLI